MNITTHISFRITINQQFQKKVIKSDWEWYIAGMVTFSLPGLIASCKQFKSGYSTEQIKLEERPFRGFY
tara:strand:- start:129 stop:335 length:207 start_codon:yes stop_codon:yes gene_type:complete